MAKLTDEYIRRAYLAQFARMAPEGRVAVIEALTVVHETVLPQSPQEHEPPLLKDADG